MPRLVIALCLLLLARGNHAQVPDSPDLGIEISPEEAARWAISIPPDGRGLPEGSGTAAAGEAVYTRLCLVCHGAGGEQGLHDRLVGGHGSLATDQPVKTIGSYWPYATTLFDYIRRTMPYFEPRTLSADDTYALTAYLLHLNGIIEAHEVMNADSLPTVRMPNRDGFVWTADVPPPE